MIRYHLRCAEGHEFEGWFRDSAAYDRQARRGQIECPDCSSIEVEKAPMAPSVVSGRARRPLSPEARARAVAREILMAAGKLRKHAEETCDYVGESFAEEARAIHYGEAEERGIYGEATPEEAEALRDEEIPIRFLGIKPRKNS